MATINNKKTENIDRQEKKELIYKSSKIVFVVMILIFFLTFYFIGAGFQKEFFEKILSPSYILLLLSLGLFVFFGSQKIFENKIISYIITTIFVIFIIFAILPLFI
ncbi:hypothetical protein BLD25_04225 [Candidatus Gracilibacteria bacterium GN02-872]|nr:hypothetical protein BLD25_04225 [Candidatus Gracilibacteria bacterium GN02-872]RKW23612.1 MAG: hypothetical protein D8B46_03090 [Candidatus Gracilibacteria bacterium]